MVFSAVESWLNFGTINAGHSRRTPRNRTASSKRRQAEDKLFLEIFSPHAFHVLSESVPEIENSTALGVERWTLDVGCSHALPEDA